MTPNKLDSPTNQIPNDLREKTNFSNRWSFSSVILEARSLNMMRIALISKIRPQNDYLISVQHNLKIVLIVFVNESFNTPLISTIEHKNIIFMHHVHNTMQHWAVLDKFFVYHTICHNFYYNLMICVIVTDELLCADKLITFSLSLIITYIMVVIKIVSNTLR